MGMFSDFWSSLKDGTFADQIFGYNKPSDAAKAFWMPGAYQADQNAKMTMLTNAENRRNIERQNQLNIEQWQRENAYNNPVNQMQRMRAAGLNPAMMYGGSGSIATSAPSPTMQGARDIAPQLGGTDDLLGKILSITRQKAEIANIEADTQGKKEETKGKEIENDVAGMTRTAFYSAYEEGLVHGAIKAGYIKDINESNEQSMLTAQAAWNTAIMFGTSVASVLQEHDVSGILPFDENNNIVPWSFDEKVFEKCKQQFVGGTEAQIEANKAAKLLASLSQEKNRKDVDIYKQLNDMASSDNWMERSVGRICLLALFISQERFSLPGINLSVDKGTKNIYLPDKKE